MAKASSSIDLRPAKDASKTATNFITVNENNGIRVHEVGAVDTNFVQINNDGMQIYKDGNQDSNIIAKFEADGAQIGLDTGPHTIIDNDGMQVFAEEVSGGSIVELANIGYGEGNTENGTGYAPYYSLGTRRRTSDVYDNTATYNVGNLVLYGNPQKTYVCVTDITTPEAWTQSHWKLAIGTYSIAEGFNTTASGQRSHAEGSATVAIGALSHAEGLGSIASGAGSHAGGFGSVASGQYSFAYGHKAKATAQYSIALGNDASATAIGEIALAGNKITINSSTLADFVTAQGSTTGGTGNTSWRYRKWKSGRIEAWAEISLGKVSPVSTAWSAPIYYIDKTITIPSGIFSAEPSNIFIMGGGSQWAPVGTWDITKTSFKCRFIKPSNSSQDLWIRVYAIKY